MRDEKERLLDKDFLFVFGCLSLVLFAAKFSSLLGCGGLILLGICALICFCFFSIAEEFVSNSFDRGVFVVDMLPFL